MELSNDQFNFLKKLYQPKIMLIDPSFVSICSYLKTNGYIKMVSILTVDDSTPHPPTELHTNSADIIIQITEQGIAYVDEYLRENKKINWEHCLSVVSLMLSLLAIIATVLF